MEMTADKCMKAFDGEQHIRFVSYGEGPGEVVVIIEKHKIILVA